MAQHFQSAPQGLHDVRHDFKQMRGLAHGRFVVHAPQQVGDDGQIAAGIELAARVGELRVGDDQRPGVVEKVEHDFGRALYV